MYLEELLRSLSIEHGPPDAETVARVALPTLGDRVVRRVNRVADEAPALAHAMTALGSGFALAAAAELAGLSDQQAGKVAHRLRRIEILRSEHPVEFVHPRVSRAARISTSLGTCVGAIPRFGGCLGQIPSDFDVRNGDRGPRSGGRVGARV